MLVKFKIYYDRDKGNSDKIMDYRYAYTKRLPPRLLQTLSQ